MNKTQPNILFFLPDQHRADWLGDNPDLPLRTPNVDKLISRGMKFTHAFTPSPLCSPARACLATGRDYERCGVVDNGQNTPLSLPTYYQHLRNAGYAVATVGKLDLHKADFDWGLDGSHCLTEYGFTSGIDNEGKMDAISSYKNNGRSPRGPYMEFLKKANWVENHVRMYEENAGDCNFACVSDLPESAYCDNWVANNGIQCLKEFEKDKPWHLVVNFVGPHGPFDITESMNEKWSGVRMPPPVDNEQSDPEKVENRRRNYAAMIENIDSLMGKMIEEVKIRGELDNTILVFSSDHGEMLGDHNRWGKMTWHSPSSKIPLVVTGPGVQTGVSSKALISLHDLAATFLDMAGAQPLSDSDAMSFNRVLSGESMDHRGHVKCSLNEWKMIFDGRYKYVLTDHKPSLLFDLEKDPHERVNLCQKYPEVRRTLEEKLLQDLEIQ
jgi:arylsulfatase A-like enzyme